ncbi:hypothetical protein BT93_H2412 [Corymbia citriodora subsp. variegata]|nr:hypothetical protein BT93_H2412 [Corymbia citriodora subsp. variegata]
MKMNNIPICKIPDALWTIEKLDIIEAECKFGLPFHVKIGNGIYRIQSLRILRLRRAKIYAVPRLPESLIILELHALYMTFPDLSNLTNLKELDMRFWPCHDDVKSNGHVEDPMPQWIGKLRKLESLKLYSIYVTTLTTDISLLPQLKALELGCSNLRCLPSLPSSLSSLYLYKCKSLCSMDLSNLKKLSYLNILKSPISEIRGLDCLENLQILSICKLRQMEILPHLSKTKKLRDLTVKFCSILVEIQGELPQSLEILRIYSCESLQKLPDLSSLKGLQRVKIEDCMKLNVDAILAFARRSRANF